MGEGGGCDGQRPRSALLQVLHSLPRSQTVSQSSPCPRLWRSHFRLQTPAPRFHGMLRNLLAAHRPVAVSLRASATRTIVQFQRPGPPPLPADQQREFEELVRTANAPTIDPSNALHPDARTPVQPEFEGETNPFTGEVGGPKREPVRRWTDEGDWSYKGRVSDF
jgi:hypothetical protein